MQEFEVIGLGDSETPHSGDLGDTSVPSSGPPRWWLLIPVVVIFGLLIVLSRGAVDQVVEEEAETSVPESTLVPNEIDDEDPVASSLTFEELTASFAGQVLLTGASGREIRVNDLATGTSFPLDIKGSPLYFVDGWLIYVEEAQVKVVNLLEASSQPIILVESEASGSGFQVLVDGSPSFLTITQFSSDGVPSSLVTGFVIGEWTNAVVADAVGGWYRTAGLVSSPGSGTYELTPDGYQRRGDGFVVGTNRDLAVMWECHESLSSCQVRVRDRTTWNTVGSSVKATPSTEMVLAPQGAIVIQIDWPQATFELVNLMTGERIELDASRLQDPYLEKLLGVSDSAALAASYGEFVVIDRVSGEITPVEVDGAPSARSGVLADSTLPYFMEQAQ